MPERAERSSGQLRVDQIRPTGRLGQRPDDLGAGYPDREPVAKILQKTDLISQRTGRGGPAGDTNHPPTIRLDHEVRPAGLVDPHRADGGPGPRAPDAPLDRPETRKRRPHGVPTSVPDKSLFGDTSHRGQVLRSLDRGPRLRRGGCSSRSLRSEARWPSQ